MKKYLLFILGCIPLMVAAQRVVLLSFDQPPPLVYNASPGSMELIISKGDSVILGNGLTIIGGSGNYFYRWSPGTALSDSIIMKPVAKPVVNTTYILTVTDRNGCSFLLDYLVTVKQGTPSVIIHENNQHLSAWVFPNPGKGNFTLQLKGKPSKIIDIMLTDNLGRIIVRCPVYGFEGEQNIILQPRVAPGTFILTVKRENEIIRKKLIVR
jgi:hypothetical protein